MVIILGGKYADYQYTPLHICVGGLYDSFKEPVVFTYLQTFARSFLQIIHASIL